MRKATIAALVCAFVLVPVAQTFAATHFQDNFSRYYTGRCLIDGERLGSWEVRYASYGCVKVEKWNNNRTMVMAPTVAASSDATHAPLVLGPAKWGDVDFSLRMKTDAQLRKNTTPNAWEVAWAIWDYTDDTHFYYVVLKPNGWELGKEDPAYPGAQRFLATGTDRTFPIGKWYNLRITRTGNTITVYADGKLLTTFTDTERPYYGGRIGLYNEDAKTRFDDISLK